MPIYLYKNKETGEIYEVYQKMNDKHEYVRDGKVCERVWTIPQGVISTKIDPFSSTQFLNTTNKTDTIGSLLDRSQELSEKRKKIMGRDVTQDKFFDKWSKKRAGRKHPQDDRPKNENV